MKSIKQFAIVIGASFLTSASAFAGAPVCGGNMVPDGTYDFTCVGPGATFSNPCSYTNAQAGAGDKSSNPLSLTFSKGKLLAIGGVWGHASCPNGGGSITYNKTQAYSVTPPTGTNSYRFGSDENAYSGLTRLGAVIGQQQNTVTFTTNANGGVTGVTYSNTPVGTTTSYTRNCSPQ